jgi:hypothetical protein
VIDSDPEREANLELLTKWWETYRCPTSVARILHDNNELTAVLAPEPEDRNMRSIGRRLMKIDGRVIGGFKLKRVKVNKGRLWSVTINGRFNLQAKYPLPRSTEQEMSDVGF